MVKSQAALQVAKLILLPALLFVSPPGWSQSCKVVQSEFSDDAVFLATQVNDGREFWLAIDSGSNYGSNYMFLKPNKLYRQPSRN